MCGCEKHHDQTKPCTCICPEHGNFQVAHDLALSRYDEIVRLRRQVAEWDEWMRLTVTHLAVEGRIDSGCGRTVVEALTRAGDR